MIINPNFLLSHLIRYDGTPLQLDDERLGEIVKWIKHHDLSVVKLDCLMHKVNLWVKRNLIFSNLKYNLYVVTNSNYWEF